MSDLFTGQFGVFLVTAEPRTWQARGPQRRTVDEAEADAKRANGRVATRTASADVRAVVVEAVIDVLPEAQEDADAIADRVAAQLAPDTRDERIGALEASVLRLTESARAAAENWMAACGQRDEARARVAELETGLRAWRADVVAAGLDDEWILTERIDALLARAAEHPDRSVPLAPGDSVVLEVDGQIAGMRTAVDPK